MIDTIVSAGLNPFEDFKKKMDEFDVKIKTEDDATKTRKEEQQASDGRRCDLVKGRKKLEKALKDTMNAVLGGPAPRGTKSVPTQDVKDRIKLILTEAEKDLSTSKIVDDVEEYLGAPKSQIQRVLGQLSNDDAGKKTPEILKKKDGIQNVFSINPDMIVMHDKATDAV